MAYSFAEALVRYGQQAREAAGAPTVRYLCRDCDHQWMSDDPICLFCGRVTPRQGAVSLFDPIHVEKPSNLGITPTRFEAMGI